MNSQLAYIFSTLIFAGSALAIIWLFAFSILKRYWKIILLTAILFVLYTPVEFFALEKHLWVYSAERTFHWTFLGAEAETYFYSFLVGLAISSWTLWFAHYSRYVKTH